MQMWGGGNPPIVLNPALIKAVYKPGPISIPDPPPYVVEVNLGQLRASSPASRSACCATGRSSARRSLAGDGTATIPAAFGDGSVKPGELEVAFEGDGAQPVKVPVDGRARAAAAPAAAADHRRQPPVQPTPATSSVTGARPIGVGDRHEPGSGPRRRAVDGDGLPPTASTHGDDVRGLRTELLAAGATRRRNGHARTWAADGCRYAGASDVSPVQRADDRSGRRDGRLASPSEHATTRRRPSACIAGTGASTHVPRHARD